VETFPVERAGKVAPWRPGLSPGIDMTAVRSVDVWAPGQSCQGWNGMAQGRDGTSSSEIESPTSTVSGSDHSRNFRKSQKLGVGVARALVAAQSLSLGLIWTG
jgi:hypothetical protein